MSKIKKERITDKFVKGLKLPDKGNKICYDDEIKGFGVRVTYKGAKSFILNYSINGRERRYTIGQYPAWSVVKAREEVKLLKQDIDKNIDPLEIRDEERSAIKIIDFYKEYEKSHIPNLSEKWAKDVKSMWKNNILPFFGTRRLKDISFKDIDKLHKKLSEKTPVKANRVLTVLRQSFNLAIRWGYLEKNPASGFKKNSEESKENYLKPSEIKLLLQKLNEMKNQTASNIIRLLILTGARKGEVLNAEWNQIDFERGEWVKPSSHTKQKRIHRVPLSKEALVLLESLKNEATDNGLIFKSSTGGKIHDIKRPWKWLMEKTKLDIRVHDLRHTYASILASSGESLPVIGKLLGHSQHQTTMRYSHLMDDPLKNATSKIGNLFSES